MCLLERRIGWELSRLFAYQGKFIRILFNADGTILGANVDWYLLEKSRVTSRNNGERNFHVFYQLLASGNKGKEMRGRSLRYHANRYIMLIRESCERLLSREVIAVRKPAGLWLFKTESYSNRWS